MQQILNLEEPEAISLKCIYFVNAWQFFTFYLQYMGVPVKSIARWSSKAFVKVVVSSCSLCWNTLQFFFRYGIPEFWPSDDKVKVLYFHSIWYITWRGTRSWYCSHVPTFLFFSEIEVMSQENAVDKVLINCSHLFCNGVRVSKD